MNLNVSLILSKLTKLAHTGSTCVLNHFGPLQLFATLWTVANQAPLPMGFSRQEYWSGLPFPSPEDLLDPGLPHCRQMFYHLSMKPDNFCFILSQDFFCYLESFMGPC